MPPENVCAPGPSILLIRPWSFFPGKCLIFRNKNENKKILINIRRLKGIILYTMLPTRQVSFKVLCSFLLREVLKSSWPPLTKDRFLVNKIIHLQELKATFFEEIHKTTIEFASLQQQNTQYQQQHHGSSEITEILVKSWIKEALNIYRYSIYCIILH